MSSFRVEASIYARHVLAVFVPGRRVQTHDVVPEDLARVGDLTGWSDDDMRLLIEECRRTLDQQQVQFDRVRTTAQVVLPLAIALLVVFGSELTGVIKEPSAILRYGSYLAWGIGTMLVVLAGLGAAATLSVRSEFGTVFPPLVSRLSSPILSDVTRAYAGQIATGERTVGTRIAVIRDAVTLLAIGGMIHLVIWVWRIFHT